MDKTAIRNFAIEARKLLMKSAITEAGFYGITKDGCKTPIQKGNDFEVYETLTGTENRIYGNDIKRRANLVKAIEQQGFDQVIEEIAYTWFNRIIAIRFMEVNNYLPTRVRVLSSETGSGTPDIITQADTVELNLSEEELDKIQNAKCENKYDEAFRILFVKQCNELNEILPGLFEKTNDYMELLLKITYTGDGVVRMLVDTIPEDNFNVETEGQVEIIGWMYQYYNTELKDDTFAKLKKNVKITKERIPAATQLFTPDWIVRYMVENSLGRVWIEHLRAVDLSVDEKAKADEFGWKYYLPEAEQEEAVAAQLVDIRKEYRDLTPQDITCIDPCMGSGHILVYMFDVLMDIYRSEGFSEREAVFDILEKNIRGLDIDRRAYQLSYFALMMKARGYNRIFFRGRENIDGERVQVVPQVYAIEESNNVNRNQLKYFGEGLSEIEKNDAINQLTDLLDQLKDAKEYGSIIEIEEYNWKLLEIFVNKYGIPGQMNIEMVGIDITQKEICHLIQQSVVLSQKYEVVITNPPYMGGSGMNAKLVDYVKCLYPDEKGDLFACFIAKGNRMLKRYGFNTMVTMQSWMFLVGFEKMREELLRHYTIWNLMHMDNMVMGIAFGTVVSNFRNISLASYRANYNQISMDDICKGVPSSFPSKKSRFSQVDVREFKKIPGSPIAYWLSKEMFTVYENPKIIDVSKPCKGIDTGDNNRFLRLWYEVDYSKLAINGIKSSLDKKWVPYNKGGAYRKWFGNNDYVVNWGESGELLKNAKGSNLRNKNYYFQKGITWSTVTSGGFGMRFFPNGYLFDNGGCCLFAKEKLLYILGLMNSCVAKRMLELSPTINTQPGDVGKIPFIYSEKESVEIEKLVEECIDIVKRDWDEKENSWDFYRHPLIKYSEENGSLRYSFEKYKSDKEKEYIRLKENEERINELFISVYGLEAELSKTVLEKEMSIKQVDEGETIKSFLSFFIGCVFGRYSLDRGGIVSAGSFSETDYEKYIPCRDNIIPIMDDAYFEDDLIDRLREFLMILFGKDNIDENMDYIAQVLNSSRKNSNVEIIRNYFLEYFFADHCSACSTSSSGKRPYYWLFDAGKENGFKCLVYIHRYDANTVGRIRSDYLLKAQGYIENAMKNVEYILQTSTSSVDKAMATKRRDKFIKQLGEIREYYIALSHIALKKIELNLDDGIKVNYAKFQGIEVSNEGEKKQTIDLLAKI